MFRALLLFVFASLFAACASGPRFAENGYPILPANRVEVYEDTADIPDTFEVLGTLQFYTERRVVGRTRVVSAEELERLQRRNPPRDRPRGIDDARREAAELGANGLLVVTRGDRISDPRVRHMLEQTTWRSDRLYVAIYVGPPPTTERDADEAR